MSLKNKKAYQLYRQEFTMLCENGTKLYCPEDVEVTPSRLARKIAGDSHATYMRDTVYDGEGRVVKISFMRIVTDK